MLDDLARELASIAGWGEERVGDECGGGWGWGRGVEGDVGESSKASCRDRLYR